MGVALPPQGCGGGVSPCKKHKGASRGRQAMADVGVALPLLSRGYRLQEGAPFSLLTPHFYTFFEG